MSSSSYAGVMYTGAGDASTAYMPILLTTNTWVDLEVKQRQAFH